jgi:hypothetical protein
MPKSLFSIGMTAGAADHSIFAFDAELGYSYRLSNTWKASARLTYGIRNGNSISNSGLGDMYTILNFNPSTDLTITAGVKIPLKHANDTQDHLPLPMDYQSTLGTFDVIAGLSYQRSGWLIALGYQQPLSQNENFFYPDAWPPESPLSEIESTLNFERQGDILLRISRTLAFTEKMSITPGILPIYHLANDKRTRQDFIEEIEGSSGLTLNVTFHLDYLIGNQNRLRFQLGFPLVVRDKRPDGLTRSFVAGVDYMFAL